MIVKILKYGSPVLRKHSEKVTKEENIKQIIADLFDTLKKEGGIGLAAPQTGVLKRIFVMDTSPLSNNDKSIEEIKQFFVNPEIIDQSKKSIIYTEGCLSIPGIYEEVERPEKIRVRYLDAFLNQNEKDFDGVQARIILHECDHLEGILFIDRLSLLRKKFLSSKLKRIKTEQKTSLPWIKIIQLRKQNCLMLRTLS
jgi:peptide deformylase